MLQSTKNSRRLQQQSGLWRQMIKRGDKRTTKHKCHCTARFKRQQLKFPAILGSAADKSLPWNYVGVLNQKFSKFPDLTSATAKNATKADLLALWSFKLQLTDSQNFLICSASDKRDWFWKRRRYDNHNQMENTQIQTRWQKNSKNWYDKMSGILQPELVITLF